jgi:hypothetical protein
MGQMIESANFLKAKINEIWGWSAFTMA